MKRPSKNHEFALVRDFFGNAGIVLKTARHIDYVYGLYKGRECLRRDDDYFEEWYKDGEIVPLLGHPTKGDIVLVMGIPITEITGDKAAEMIAEIKSNERREVATQS